VIIFTWYVFVLLVVGATSAARACAEAPVWPRRLTAIAVGAAWMLVGIVLLRLWSQTNDAFGGDGPLTMAYARIILFETPWGGGWMWQAGTSALTCLVVSAWRVRWALWPAAAICASAAAFTTGLTGHAVGMEGQTWITVWAHGLHVIAAGWWIGALAVILLVTSRTDFHRDVQARLSLAEVVNRFSPVAIVAVSVLVIAGGIATWRHVIVPAGFDGFASPYGLALAVKIGAFFAAGLCGLYNWRVLSPALAGSADAARQFRAMAWLEVCLGLVAIVLTALLGTLSMPEPAGETDHPVANLSLAQSPVAQDQPDAR
jgi:putative copper resistance protein D